MSRLVIPICLVTIVIVLRALWPTVLTFVHSFPSWLWGDAGLFTLILTLALATGAAYALVWVMRVREALKRWK